MYCPNCGAENRDDAAFCLSCRGTLEQRAPASAAWATPFFDREISSDDVMYAGFWDRFWALLLDAAFSILIGVVPALALAALLRHTGIALAAALFTWLTGALAYHVIATAYGGGFGMRIMGIRIVRTDNGARPGFARAFSRVIARSVLGVVPVLGGILQLVDGLWMIKDPHKQTWHDKAARTYVVER